MENFPAVERALFAGFVGVEVDGGQEGWIGAGVILGDGGFGAIEGDDSDLFEERDGAELFGVSG